MAILWEQTEGTKIGWFPHAELCETVPTLPMTVLDTNTTKGKHFMQNKQTNKTHDHCDGILGAAFDHVLTIFDGIDLPHNHFLPQCCLSC